MLKRKKIFPTIYKIDYWIKYAILYPSHIFYIIIIIEEQNTTINITTKNKTNGQTDGKSILILLIPGTFFISLYRWCTNNHQSKSKKSNPVCCFKGIKINILR